MHSLIPATDARSAIDPDHTRAIKSWVSDILHLTDDDVVTVHEFGCLDAGCPLVSTHIVVFAADGSTRQWKLTRQRYAIARFIVEQALAPTPV
jgi:hypothetical protein